MMRHCHYKQSLVLSHANDLCNNYNFGYNTSIQKGNNQTDSIKAFINILLRSIVINVQILTSTLSFLPRFCTVTKYIHQNVDSDVSQFPEVFVFHIPKFYSFRCLPTTIHACVLVSEDGIFPRLISFS